MHPHTEPRVALKTWKKQLEPHTVSSTESHRRATPRTVQVFPLCALREERNLSNRAEPHFCQGRHVCHKQGRGEDTEC